MAFRNRSYRKKTYKRKRPTRNVRRRSSRRTRQPGVSKTHRQVLAYTQAVSVSPGAAINDQVFRGSSIFDPDLTGVGSQPLFHDQWATLYEKYVASAASISVMFYNTSGVPVRCSIVAHKEATGITDPYQAMELPMSRTRTTTGGNLVTFNKHFVRAKQLIPLADKRNLQSSFGSSPSDNWFYHIVLSTFDDSTNVTGKLTVRMKYYCQFSQPLMVSAS